jgi:hypothetical protein
MQRAKKKGKAKERACHWRMIISCALCGSGSGNFSSVAFYPVQIFQTPSIMRGACTTAVCPPGNWKWTNLTLL